MELYTILNYGKEKQNKAYENNDVETLKVATKYVNLLGKIMKED